MRVLFNKNHKKGSALDSDRERPLHKVVRRVDLRLEIYGPA